MFKPRTVCGDIFQIPIPLGSLKCLDESECPLHFEESKIARLFDSRQSSWNQLVQKIIQTRSDMSGFIQNIHSIPDTSDSNIDKEIKIIDNAIGPTILYMSYIRMLEFFLSRNIPVVRTKTSPNGIFLQSYWTSPIKEKIDPQVNNTWTAYTVRSLQAEIEMCFLTLALLYHSLGITKLKKKDKSLVNEVTSHYYTAMVLCRTVLAQYKSRTQVKLFDLDLYEPVQNIILNDHQILVFIEIVSKLAHISIILANIKNVRTDDIDTNFPESEPLCWIRRDFKTTIGEYINIKEGGYEMLIMYQKLHLSLVVQIINTLVFLRKETIIGVYSVIELTQKAINSMTIYVFIEFLKLMKFIIYEDNKPDICSIVYTKYDNVRQEDITLAVNMIYTTLQFMLNFIISISVPFITRREIVELNKKVKDLIFIVCQTIQPMLKNNKYELFEQPMIPDEIVNDSDNRIKFDIPINISSLEPIMKSKLEKMYDFINNNNSMIVCINLLLYNCFPIRD